MHQVPDNPINSVTICFLLAFSFKRPGLERKLSVDRRAPDIIVSQWWPPFETGYHPTLLPESFQTARQGQPNCLLSLDIPPPFSAFLFCNPLWLFIIKFMGHGAENATGNRMVVRFRRLIWRGVCRLANAPDQNLVVPGLLLAILFFVTKYKAIFLCRVTKRHLFCVITESGCFSVRFAGDIQYRCILSAARKNSAWHTVLFNGDTSKIYAYLSPNMPGVCLCRSVFFTGSQNRL
jgi:hypothetical protein